MRFQEPSASKTCKRNLLHDLMDGVAFVCGILLPEFGNH